jgi:hypothetical protein
MKTNILQETIRRILKEENNLLLMIRRRVPHDVLEREFIESLDKSSGMLVSVSQNGGGIRDYESFEKITLEIMILGIHYELRITTPPESWNERTLRNEEWYDNLYNGLKDYYKHRINVRYNNLLLDL